MQLKKMSACPGLAALLCAAAIANCGLQAVSANPQSSTHASTTGSQAPRQRAAGRRLHQSYGGGVSMQYDNGIPDHLDISGNSVTIRIDPQGTARARSVRSYPLGTTFTTSIKCPSGDESGIVTGFYLSSGEGTGDEDEVDFEFVANDKSRVQTNYWINGEGHHEEYIDLGSDCASGFRTYGITYGATSEFIIDGQVVRQASGFTKDVFLYVIGWTGGDPYWVGSTDWANSPYYFEAQNIVAT